jgi:hypothetical protein
VAARKGTGPTPVEAITHDDKRVNIPTADAQDFVDPATRAPVRLRYPRDPTLDPQLVWNGKDDQDSDDLLVEAPPLYIQEKVDPRVLIENLRRTASRPQDEPELTLFDTFDGLEGMQSIEFYKHAANWSNRCSVFVQIGDENVGQPAAGSRPLPASGSGHPLACPVFHRSRADRVPAATTPSMPGGPGSPGDRETVTVDHPPARRQ